jgi:alpha-mannosidase
MNLNVPKIKSRIKEIEKKRYAASLPLSKLRAERLEDGASEVVWLSEGDRWGVRDANYLVSFDLAIPAEWRGQSLALNLNLSIMPDSFSLSTVEGLLCLDGVPFHALDRYHREIILPPEKTAQPNLAVTVKLWTGNTSDYHLVGKLELALPNPAADQLHLLMSLVFDALNTLAEESPTYQALFVALDEACGVLDFRQPGNSEAFYASCQVALAVLNRRLQALERESSDWQPHVVATGHAHIDVAWLWRLKHTRLKAAHTFSTALYHMDRYPHFIFTQSQPQLYQFVKEDQPALYERIKQKVAGGQWEPEGAMWVEADTNLTGGESLVRQFLFGQRFFRQEFGRTSKVLWLPDVFGYSAALPQLIKGAGADYFITTKISWNETNRMPMDTFWWQGIDGSRVLAYFITAQNDDHSYNFYTYNGEMRPEVLALSWKNYREKDLNREMLLAYGFGDGGGGPTRSMIEAAGLLSHSLSPELPTAATGKVADFMDRLAGRVGNNPNLPAWVGELYLEFHRGTYTSQARIKRANRLAERDLHNAELLASSALVQTGQPYPQPDLNEAWKIVLTHQFHDILPGSSIGAVYSDAVENYAQVARITGRVTGEAQQALVENLAAPADSLVVFNPLSWPRSEPVEIAQTQADKLGLPTQALTDGQALVQVETVPSMGYCWFEPDTNSTAKPANGLSVSASLLENKFYRLELDNQGQVSRLLDKTGYAGAGREVLRPGEMGNVLQFFEDKPVQFNAWNIDAFYEQKSYRLDQPPTITVIEQGPLRAGLKLEWLYQGRTRITQYLYLYAESRRIDFVTEVDWQERQTLLKVAFPVEVLNGRATAEIQFGNLERPTHRNTSWDKARFETCAHKWIDLSEGNYGVALLNDCKYGYDIQGSTMRLTLLRGPVSPDPLGDLGLHRFTYSLLPHAGDWFEGGANRAAYELNNPLLAVVKASGAAPKAANSERDFSLVQVEPSNVVVETVKRAEDSDGLIVRVYECANRRGPFNLKFAFPFRSAAEVNLLEEEQAAAQIGSDGQSIQSFIAPFEIKSYLVNF